MESSGTLSMAVSGDWGMCGSQLELAGKGLGSEEVEPSCLSEFCCVIMMREVARSREGLYFMEGTRSYC